MCSKEKGKKGERFRIDEIGQDRHKGKNTSAMKNILSSYQDVSNGIFFTPGEHRMKMRKS